MDLTTAPTYPIPVASERTIERNETAARPEGWSGEVCAVCYRPLLEVSAMIYTVYGADAVDPAFAAEHLTDLEQHPAYSGMYALGSSCARKIPAAFRVKVNG